MSNNNNPTLRKTRTFLLKKSDSMQLPTVQPMEVVPKRSASLRFPTSPQLVLGEEMLHVSHPQHPLSHVNLPDLFTCAGCKEYGAGKRFTCQQCDYQLHDFCALAPPALKSHPFHCQHQLVFYSKPGMYWLKLELTIILSQKCTVLFTCTFTNHIAELHTNQISKRRDCTIEVWCLQQAHQRLCFQMWSM